MSKKAANDKLRKWVENVATNSDLLGYTRLGCRIIMYLLMSDPEAKSAKQISEFLDIAKSAVSVELRHLLQTEEIIKIRKVDDRTEFYRLSQDYWSIRLAKAHKDNSDLYTTIQLGFHLVEDNQSHARIQEMVAFFEWRMQQSKENLEEWREKYETIVNGMK